MAAAIATEAFRGLARGYQSGPDEIEGRKMKMGILDKLTGRAKQAAGDLADDPSLRREGRNEEKKGEKKEERDRAREQADRKADEAAEMERKT